MPKLKLTEKAVAKLAAPTQNGRPVLFWDNELKGFAVLCSGKSNAKTYVVQRDLPGGRPRRLSNADSTTTSACTVCPKRYTGTKTKFVL